ncbi:MAG: nucleotidyl transferase AbiEii/AbiGii toxin family protein [Myxococcota bacterium]
MSILTTFLDVIRRFEDAGIDYMVVGSVASIVYGQPRMTHDMDLVIDAPGAAATRIAELFPDDEFYVPPIEVLRAEWVQKGQFNLIHHESGLKIDVIIRKSSEHAVEEFARRRRVPFIGDAKVVMASPEDVILKKLSYFREGGSEKHLTDIRGILAEADLDQPYLERWLEALSLRREWDKI